MKYLSTIVAFTVITFLAGSAITCAAKKETPDQKINREFEVNFNNKIDLSNKTLAIFINLPCSTDGDALKAAYVAVESSQQDIANLMSNIPDSQDGLTQSRELELGYGYIYLSNRFVGDKIDTCKTPDTTSPPPDNGNLKSSTS